MTAPIFFKPARSLSLGEIATLAGATARDGVDLAQRIRGVAALDRAVPGDLSFLDNTKYAAQAQSTLASACLTSDRLADRVPPHIPVLCVREPYRAFVEVARALFPDSLRPSSLFEAGGVAPGAFVHATARLENGVSVDPSAVIGPQAEIGSGTVIAPGAIIGPKVRIGRDCSIGANVVITHALIGDRVIVHPGCAIGQDGFGFVMGAQGHRKVPQVGRVIIQDDVEIGANSTIDRGASRDTVIGEGSKIDNLVQIAHNVSVGRHCILAAHTGISGSVIIEDFVVMGGRVGVADHLSIGTGAMLAAGSGVITDVPARSKWGGTPAVSVREWLKGHTLVQRMVRGGRGQPTDE